MVLSEAIAARLAAGGTAPLVRRIDAAIRSLILSGELAAGRRLPSSRELAADLGVGRNTVVHAYEQLLAEGYLASRAGAGTFVPDALPARRPVPPPASPGSPRRAAARLSSRAAAVLGEAGILGGGAFATCVPDLGRFPFPLWRRLLARAWREVRARELAYEAPCGHEGLRAQIAEYVRLTRQVRCDPAQVIVVNGAQHGLDLCARLLADAGDRAWVEDPGYPGARRAFRAADLELVPIPVDAEGLAPSAARRPPPPRLVYITPSHQFPTGVVTSLARRRELLALAARHGAWILEDDYDGEFRMSGPPIASLQGIDEAGRVVYVGTFSKALFPAIRIGYLVVPAALVGRFSDAVARLTLAGPRVGQAALCAFLREGHFAAHVRRMRALYTERRGLLLDAWERELGGFAPLSGVDTGMHVLASLPRGTDAALSREAARQGLVAQSLASLFLGRPSRSGLVLGYGAVHERELPRRATALARLVAAAQRHPR